MPKVSVLMPVYKTNEVHLREAIESMYDNIPAVSIIVPVYNVEQYLRQSIESIIHQTFENIEIICINDGSTDDSFSILTEYAKNDHRIVLINQDNKGVSIARNKGIEIAKGEYIIFVDPDDWIELNAVEIVYNKMKEKDVDMLCYGYKCYVNGNVFSGYRNKFLKKYEAENEIPDIDLIHFMNCVWDKMYKRNFIKEKMILFPENIKISEDGYFNLLCLLGGATLGVLNKDLYYYRLDRIGSAMSKKDQLIDCEISSLLKFVEEDAYKNASERFKIFVLDKFLREICYFCSVNNNKLLNIRKILKFAKDIKYIISEELLNKTCGYRNIKKCLLRTFLLQKLLSLKNEREGNIKWKVLTILWIKIKFNKRVIK